MLSKTLSHDRVGAETSEHASWQTFASAADENKAEGFGTLMQVVETRLKPGAKSEPRAFARTECLSYVISGELLCSDDQGNSVTASAGECQVTSAGNGIVHTEANGSAENELHYVQFRIAPNFDNTTPGYQQKNFADELDHQFRVVVSPYAEYGSLMMRQRARLWAGKFEAGEEVQYETNYNQRYWLQMATGEAEVNGVLVGQGDGLALEDEDMITVKALAEAEVLLLELQIE